MSQTSPLHLSALQLDALLSGDKADTDHLTACTECRARLQAMRKDAEGTRRLPEFEATFRRIASMNAGSRGASWARWSWLGLAMGAIAAGVLFVARPEAALDRIKGQPTLSLLRAEDGMPANVYLAGERVRLSVAGRAGDFAIVLSVDESGHTETVWPRDGVRSERLPTTQSALKGTFAITPGPFLLCAVFSETPLEEPPLRQNLEHLAQDALRRGTGLQKLTLTSFPGESAHAQLYVSVHDGP